MKLDKRWKEYKRSLLMYKLSKDKNSEPMKKLALRLNKMFKEITDGKI